MSELDLHEGVELGYVLALRTAAKAGVRALAIKGPALHLQGLRPPRQSNDVDVLVEPEGVAHLRTALAAAGWTVRVPPTSAQIMPLHAIAVANPTWPCEIDLHGRVPGFLAEPAHSFEVLWRRRVVVALAGAEVPTCDPIAHAALMAVNVLRDNGGRMTPELEGLWRILDGGGRDELHQFAAQVGAVETLRPFLGEGPVAGSLSGPVDDDLLRDWRLQLAAQQRKAVPAIHELARAPLSRWPRLIARSLLLTEAEIREKQPDAAPGWRGLQVARLRRIGWGIRDLPAAILLVWRSRRG